MMTEAHDRLKEWLERNAVRSSWGNFDGIQDFRLDELGALKVLVEAAIAEKFANKDYS